MINVTNNNTDKLAEAHCMSRCCNLLLLSMDIYCGDISPEYVWSTKKMLSLWNLSILSLQTSNYQISYDAPLLCRIKL